MVDEDIIEIIAKRWFDQDTPVGSSATWEGQPESVKDVCRRLARAFWNKPSVLYDQVRLDREADRNRVNRLDVLLNKFG